MAQTYMITGNKMENLTLRMAAKRGANIRTIMRPKMVPIQILAISPRQNQDDL